jgi:hypothetical protein
MQSSGAQYAGMALTGGVAVTAWGLQDILEEVILCSENDSLCPDTTLL